MTRPLYIFDLDGTVTNPSARRALVENGAKKWDEFYERCGEDTPNEYVINVLKALWRLGAEIWFFTGRPERTRIVTEEWLNNNVANIPIGNFWNVTMRPEKDYTADHLLKGQWVDAMLPCDRERLVASFDDRDRVVAMWRSKGIPCFQVAPGAF